MLPLRLVFVARQLRRCAEWPRVTVMPRIILLLALGGMLVFLSACASTEPQDPNSVSTIPWNRPEQWEGQGALGGFAPNSR